MMKQPTQFEIDQLMHFYDPAKAHEYYLKNRDLKGRKKAAPKPPPGVRPAATNAIKAHPPKNSQDPRAGKTKAEIHKNSRTKQRKELAAAIQGLQERLVKLEALIKKRIHEEDSHARKSAGKKERAAKESAKPQTAAEKSKAARASKKSADKHQQSRKTQAKQAPAKSGGSSSKSKKSASGSEHNIPQLQSLAKKVRGQIATAKQKLAAL